MKWCRLYKEFISDTKIISLPDSVQLCFIKLLCLRIDGELLDLDDKIIARQLRTSIKKWMKFREILVKNKLLNDDSEIKNWDKYQYSSDSTYKRVKKFRHKIKNETFQKRFRNVSCKEKSLKANSKNNTCPFEQIVVMYHAMLPELSRVIRITDSRKKHMRQRWLRDLQSIEEWSCYFENVRQQQFLMGSGSVSRTWKANFDWLIIESNCQKVIGGNYVSS